MVKKKEKAKVDEEMRRLEPKNVLPTSTKFNWQDRKLGFRAEDVKEAIEKKRKKKREEEKNKLND